MKKLSAFASFVLIALTFSCGGDEDNGPGYKFIDQDAAGEIDNVSWTYADGYASIDDFGGGEMRVSVDLTLPQVKHGCDMDFPEGDAVFFSVPNEVGLYKLKFDFNCSNNCDDEYTVTLFKKDGFENFIASEGAVEILAISASEVSGRLDARYDDNSYVNGNFTVSICP